MIPWILHKQLLRCATLPAMHLPQAWRRAASVWAFWTVVTITLFGEPAAHAADETKSVGTPRAVATPTEEEEDEAAEDRQVLLPGARRIPQDVELAGRIRLYWNQGPHIDGPHFQAMMGGRIQFDFGVLHPSDEISEELGPDGTEFRTELRRARLHFVGVVRERFYLRIDYDFAQEHFADLLIGIKNLRYIERIELGNLREPFSLEEMVNSNDLTFMERGLPNALVPGRNSGIRIDGTYLNRRLGVSGGVFANTATVEQFRTAFASDTGEGVNLTVRVSGLPWYEDHGRRLLHLGFAYSHQFRNDQDLDYQSQPESFLAPVLVDTGEVESDGNDLINASAALVHGPWSVQAEYMGSFVSPSDGGSRDFGGVYFFASYFLTGEHRPFNRRWPRFVRLVPHRQFSFRGKGWGAWELAARYSHLDLDSGFVDGGVLNDVTAGINWYVTPNMRVTANYISSWRRSVGHTGIAQIRLQIAY